MYVELLRNPDNVSPFFTAPKSKGKAPRAVVKAVKAKSKVVKAGSLTKELIDKAVRHIPSEIVAARPGLDSRTPRGFAEGLLKDAQEAFPR
jgi:hypothetical protein